MTWTKKEIDDLSAEFKKDLSALKAAMDALQERALAVEDTSHEAFFTYSSIVQAAMHVLNIGITSTEGILEDLEENREKALDQPKLSLVQGEGL